VAEELIRRGGCRLLAAVALLAVPAASALAQDGAVRGVVRNARTDSTVAGAVVIVSGTLLGATADEGGRFRLPGVPAGAATLRVFAIGYTSHTERVTIVAGRTLDLSVRLAPSALSIAPVVVTASRRPEAAAQAAVSVSELPAVEIMRHDVSNIEAALPFVPGVTFNGPGQMDIRGSTGTAAGVGSRVLILLDGHPMLSADGGEIIWEALPLLDVQRVEVIKGAYSAVYGSNALGGVANIITSPIATDPRTVIRAHYDYIQVPGEYRFADHAPTADGVELQHSQVIGGVGVRVAGSREASDGAMQNGNYARWFLRTKVTSRPGSAHPWDGYAIWSRNDAGNFLAWRSGSQPFEVDSQYLGDRAVYETLYAGGTLTPLVGSRAILKVSPSVSYNGNQDYFHTDQDYHRAWRGGTSVQLTLQPDPRHTVLTGVDGALTTLRSNFLGTPTLRDFGVYAQDQWAVTPRLQATIGGRVDYHSTTQSRAESSFNPKLAVRYLLSPRVTLRASVGRGYRAPSAIEQFVSAVQFGYRVIPNPALHGENAVSGEVGINAGLWRGVRLDAALFESVYHDLIGPTAAPDSVFVFQFRNVQRARIRGLDAGLDAAIVPGLLQARLSYMYLDPVDLETHQWLPYRSRHNATLSLDALGGLAGLDVRYRSRIANVLVYPLDPRSDITLVDLRANYEIHGTVVQGKVSNLFNRVYPDVQERMPGQPRTFTIAVLKRF
jgi:outer membrane receptor for ferrienterochelin and colicins